jgi:hypothetical protein
MSRHFMKGSVSTVVFTFFSFAVVEHEFMASILSHSHSFFFIVGGFWRYGFANYLSGMALNRDPPDLFLLSS